MVNLAGAIPLQLQAAIRKVRLGPDVPVMLAHPEWGSGVSVPIVLWMHGRTVRKEIDPGRYLRWIRAGIGACAIDLPGHGERYDEALQSPYAAWDVLTQMVEEIDPLLDALRDYDQFDHDHIAIGGMSLGGMATLARLTRPHPFTCTSVEATSGSWTEQRDRAMFERHLPAETQSLEPIEHLDTWREIPFQAIHTRADEWVKFDAQQRFVDALRARYADPTQIEFVIYDETGAPYEHAGFGRHAADAKNRQRDFLVRRLVQDGIDAPT